VKLPCSICGNQLDTSRSNTAQRVTGWVSPRSGGGANHIRYQVRQKEWAHVACLEEADNPVATNQQAMF
jgi:hypothetical protein